MQRPTAYGLIWVSERRPYFRDWRGKQRYEWGRNSRDPARGIAGAGGLLAQPIEWR